MMKRNKATDTINSFPQDFELEELLAELIFTEKVEEDLKQLDEGKTVSHEKVKE